MSLTKRAFQLRLAREVRASDRKVFASLPLAVRLASIYRTILADLHTTTFTWGSVVLAAMIWNDPDQKLVAVPGSEHIKRTSFKDFLRRILILIAKDGQATKWVKNEGLRALKDCIHQHPRINFDLAEGFMADASAKLVSDPEALKGTSPRNYARKILSNMIIDYLRIKQHTISHPALPVDEDGEELEIPGLDKEEDILKLKRNLDSQVMTELQKRLVAMGPSSGLTSELAKDLPLYMNLILEGYRKDEIQQNRMLPVMRPPEYKSLSLSAWDKVLETEADKLPPNPISLSTWYKTYDTAIWEALEYVAKKHPGERWKSLN